MFPLLNSDLGEEAGHDEAIMPFIDAVNIACGYHAGNIETMQRTVELAMQHDIMLGAHPSYPDRENFGRTKMRMSPGEVYELVTQQLFILYQVAAAAGATVKHVKPHGALYNDSATDLAVADTIARAVKDFDSSLILVGLSGSYSLEAARKLGLKAMSEVFADRRYLDDGSLAPRADSLAMITSVPEAVEQVMEMINDKTVTAISGKKIPVLAETICVHGDERGAVEILVAVREVMKS